MRARSSRWLSTMRAHSRDTKARSRPLHSRQSLNAEMPQATASSICCVVTCGTEPMISWVDGLMTETRGSDVSSTQTPPIYADCSKRLAHCSFIGHPSAFGVYVHSLRVL